MHHARLKTECYKEVLFSDVHKRRVDVIMRMCLEHICSKTYSELPNMLWHLMIPRQHHFPCKGKSQNSLQKAL